MQLTATDQTLRIVLSAAGAVDCLVDWVDLPATGDPVNGSTKLEVTASGETTLVAAPASTTTRKIKAFYIRNAGAANQVTIRLVAGAVTVEPYAATLNNGQSFGYTAEGGFKSGGAAALAQTNYPILVAKTGSIAPEAIGVMVLPLTIAGSPGALTIGTPGLSGRNPVPTEAGIIQLPSGGVERWVEDYNIVSAAQNGSALLHDLLQINSGLVVTTTTAQTVNTIALPPRDQFDGTNGIGCLWGLYVSAATTNAAAVANTTASYTNSDGATGRTATILSFPATCQAQTFIPFSLQAGDHAAASFQSVSLGTSYGGGAIHLACIRPLTYIATLVNTGHLGSFAPFKLPAAPCLVPGFIPNAGTTFTFFGSMVVSVRG